MDVSQIGEPRKYVITSTFADSPVFVLLLFIIIDGGGGGVVVHGVGIFDVVLLVSVCFALIFVGRSQYSHNSLFKYP